MSDERTPPAPAPSADWLDALPACVLVALDSRVHYANRATMRLLDARTPDELLGRDVQTLIHPLDLHRVLGRIRRAERDDVVNPVTEYRALTCTGRQLVIAMTSRHIQVDGRGAVLTSFLDMTERAAMEARLVETDQNFQRIMNTMQDVFYRTDAEGVTRYVCPAVRNVIGYSAEEIVGLPAAAFYPDHRERDALKEAIRLHGFVHDFPGRMLHKDGRIIDISISTHALRDEEGQYAGVEGIWRDITQRKSMERELERLATRDDLTGLANRRHILELLELAFRGAGGGRRGASRPLCLLAIDLDHFKRVNDRHGHAAGDEALRHVVRLAEAQTRTTDRLGRLGGEEFLLLLEDSTTGEAREVAERIRLAVESSPVAWARGPEVRLTVSIGIARRRAGDTAASELLERADAALYRAKAAGRNRVCFEDEGGG